MGWTSSMIVELIRKVSEPKNILVVMTRTKVHFFHIQLTIEKSMSNSKRNEGDIQT
jgi:hypothetical protein